MVNNYALICANEIVDIFYDSEYPIFAPQLLSGEPIICVTLDQITPLEGQEIKRGDFVDENYNVIVKEPIVPEEPEPTEEEILQAEMLLNQIEILDNQQAQDEVLAEILLNQMEV